MHSWCEGAYKCVCVVVCNELKQQWRETSGAGRIINLKLSYPVTVNCRAIKAECNNHFLGTQVN